MFQGFYLDAASGCRGLPSESPLFRPLRLTVPGSPPTLRAAVPTLLLATALRPAPFLSRMPLALPTALLNRIAAAGLLVIGCAAHAQGVAQASTTTSATPPPGTMTGAYGQSLQQQAAADKAAPAAAKPAQAGNA